MKIGLIDVDGHNFPNFALMRISGYHKAIGDDVEWAKPIDLFTHVHYDRIYASKIFTFSPDINISDYSTDEFLGGGTGYDIKSCLAPEIEASTKMDYSLYPEYPFSVQFFSRGCIRHCPFCLVHDKEGYIHPVEPVELNPNGQWIEILDNNFFANPKWREAVDYILATKQKVKLHGVDVRIMNEEQAEALNKMKHVGTINIAWDLPKMDLRPQLEAMVKHVNPSKISCYVLIGFNSTKEQDLFRVRTLKSFGIVPFAQAYRDFENKRKPTQYEKDFCRWCDNRFFRNIDFLDFEPRKGFKCSAYFNLNPET